MKTSTFILFLDKDEDTIKVTANIDNNFNKYITGCDIICSDIIDVDINGDFTIDIDVNNESYVSNIKTKEDCINDFKKYSHIHYTYLLRNCYWHLDVVQPIPIILKSLKVMTRVYYNYIFDIVSKIIDTSKGINNLLDIYEIEEANRDVLYKVYNYYDEFSKDSNDKYIEDLYFNRLVSPIYECERFQNEIEFFLRSLKKFIILELYSYYKKKKVVKIKIPAKKIKSIHDIILMELVENHYDIFKGYDHIRYISM